jgi:RNA 2',3'-cyclic 3'-phosphodiesterase
VHLTLAFLGERAEADVAALRAAVRGCADGVAAPALALGGALWLAPRRPHVLTVALLDGEGALERLQADRAGALRGAVGFEPERRAFRPHVTLARVRRGQRPRLDAVPPPPVAEAFRGEAVCLMRSHLSPPARGGAGGVGYEALARVPLRS